MSRRVAIIAVLIVGSIVGGCQAEHQPLTGRLPLPRSGDEPWRSSLARQGDFILASGGVYPSGSLPSEDCGVGVDILVFGMVSREEGG